jgi:hypothetical protein
MGNTMKTGNQPTGQARAPFNDSATDAPSAISDDLAAMLDFVTLTFGATAEHLPHPDALMWRAESWLKLLTPHFFQPEMHYVFQVCCRLRGDRRDAIKADEILRIAEKVYGCPVAVWGNSDFDRDPQVWSIKENKGQGDWISLEQALERLGDALSATQVEEGKEDARRQLLAMIYGGNEQ